MMNQAGIIIACKDIAVFHTPTGPAAISPGHPIWKMAPQAGPPGPEKRHWWTMGNKWDFSDKAFAEARKVLQDFAKEEVKGPIDVVLGFSQGAAACTQILNNVADGQMKAPEFKDLRGAIMIGCPAFPRPDSTVAGRTKVLVINSAGDKLTSL